MKNVTENKVESDDSKYDMGTGVVKIKTRKIIMYTIGKKLKNPKSNFLFLLMNLS